MLYKNLSQLTPGAGKNIQNSSIQGSNYSNVTTTGESKIARRGCCGGRGNNIDIDIDIDINIGGGNNWC
ncbi:hypothetical protein DFA_10986 [Cavenderia fasciculata]|uniref:Uncharacterized protein n=1 Tax=Cavenderia fasciculata TaxID=261658 RepID=F4QBY8_CACFS|nr:uncharacterized protein DFA_10986 [Cavenderia fasciculata]EGG14726.1 hypothetical protein DFA_10986 [Cavenderia fasciculata]|eukprot:XP_004351234.1 hypothetical protein DFA_10986 [Cavenderia fasciculata]